MAINEPPHSSRGRMKKKKEVSSTFQNMTQHPGCMQIPKFSLSLAKKKKKSKSTPGNPGSAFSIVCTKKDVRGIQLLVKKKRYPEKIPGVAYKGGANVAPESVRHGTIDAMEM